MSEQGIGTVFQRVQLLLDKSYEEIKLYWIRTNIFLILNVASFGLIAPRIQGAEPLEKPVLVAASLGGVLFCMIWFQVNRCSKYHYHLWRKDAKQLLMLEGNQELKRDFCRSLFLPDAFDHSTQEGCSDKCSDSECPRRFGITTCIQILVGLMLSGWLAVLSYAVFCMDK